MKKFIKLPNSLISVEEKLAMAALIMSAKNDDETVTSIAHMEALLTKVSKSNRNTKDALLTGIIRLNDKEVIKIVNKPNKASDFFEVTINIREETFTIVYYHEIREIMGGDYTGAINRELFGYYCTLASFFNNITKVAYPSREMLADTTRISIKTVDKYNKKLIELQLIHIESNGYIQINNGIQNLKNTYSRLEHQALCKIEADKYKSKLAKSGLKLISSKNKNIIEFEYKGKNKLVGGFGIYDFGMKPSNTKAVANGSLR